MARQRAFANRIAVSEGRNPLAEKRLARVPTFRQAAEKTFQANRPRWRSAKVAANWMQQMERHVFDRLGDMPVDRIGREHVLSVLSPIWAVSLYRSGVLVQVPRPERFAMHKLIVAERCRAGPDSLKAAKDRAQADFLIAALAELRPDELRLAHDEAVARGPGWRDRIEASPDRLPAARERLLETAGG